MAIPTVAFKRQNHRLLLCEETRKAELLAQLLVENEGRQITVVTAGDPAVLSVPDTVTVLSDDALERAETCDLLISYDLPEAPQRYLARMALAREGALVLLGQADRPRLMGIETLLGRAISQERPEGFAPEESAAPTQRPKRYKKPGARLNDETAPKKAPFKPKAKGGAPRKPKASGVSRYIGTDENGKPMFSGKTGERNHRYDGKPHTDESLAAKKEWEAKRKKSGGKKPYDAKKKSDFKGNKKPYSAKKEQEKPAPSATEQKSESSKPKRPMIRIKASALKKEEPKK